MRFWAMAWLEHSMKAYSQPASAMRESRLLSSIGSGVVCVAGSLSPSM